MSSIRPWSPHRQTRTTGPMTVPVRGGPRNPFRAACLRPAVGIGWAGRAGAQAGAKLRSVRNFSTNGETRTGENWRSSPVSLHHRRQHQWVPLDRCRRCHPPSGASAGASSPPGPQKAPKHRLCGPWSDHRPSSGSIHQVDGSAWLSGPKSAVSQCYKADFYHCDGFRDAVGL